MRAVCRSLVAAVIGLGLAAGAALPCAQARETVNFDGFSAGTIVVKTNERRLYYVLGGGKALRYPVGVGKAGKAWSGTAYILRMVRNPDWSPPAEVKRDHPSMPDVIRGGTPQNPMGVAAMTLSRGEYAIHGTNRPGSVGGFVSYGCIRMYNQDITDLYSRVHFGTPVVVLR
jgi:lipoprotein-anchoring transpeptidase ErfK/SrfK